MLATPAEEMEAEVPEDDEEDEFGFGEETEVQDFGNDFDQFDEKQAEEVIGSRPGSGEYEERLDMES
jgi:hypothetical protein